MSGARIACMRCAAIYRRSKVVKLWRTSAAGAPEAWICLQCVTDLLERIETAQKDSPPGPALSEADRYELCRCPSCSEAAKVLQAENKRLLGKGGDNDV